MKCIWWISIAFLARLAPVLALMSFVNPAPESSTQSDFTLNEVYTEDTLVPVTWTGTEDGISADVTMYQINTTLTDGGTATAGAVFGDLEYITQGTSSNTTGFSWTVTTRKDLSESNVFMMVIFETGGVSPDAWSVPFNISAKSSGSSTTTSSTSTASPTTSDAVATTVASSSASECSQDGMTTGVKAGIGGGIAGAAIVGFAVGWLVCQRCQRTVSPSKGPVGMHKDMRELPVEYTATPGGQAVMASPPYSGTTSTFSAHNQAHTAGYGSSQGRFAEPEPPVELDTLYTSRR